MNRQQALFLLLVSLVVLVSIAGLVVLVSNPSTVPHDILNDCTREIVGNCLVIR